MLNNETYEPYLRWFLTPAAHKQLQSKQLLHYHTKLFLEFSDLKLTRFYHRNHTYTLYLHKCTYVDILNSAGVAISCRVPYTYLGEPYAVVKLLIPGVSKTSLFDEPQDET